MKKRIVFGSLMIVLVAGLFALDWWLEGQALAAAARAQAELGYRPRPVIAPVLAVLLVALVLVGTLELVRMAAGKGVMLLRVSAMVGASLLATFPFWWQMVDPQSPLGPTAGELLLFLGLVGILVFGEQMVRCRVDDAIRQIAATFLVIFYLGIGAALVLQMRIGYGMGVLILFLAAVKCTDIGAYFTGSAIGRHKMIPWLSPGKSWEGLAGGVLVAAGVALLAAWILRIDALLWWEAPVFGALVGLAGQFADLCESLLKRDADIKDSGALVPNFGGVLDIVDSPLLAAPVATALLAVMI
jgi:phosphatidate cytidylyltransferase